MRRKYWILMLAVCIPATTYAGLNGSIDYSSRYIWRGFDLNPDNEPVVQPSLTWSFGTSGVAVNLWSSVSFEEDELTEIDLTLSYDRPLSDALAFSAGFIHYGWYFTEDFEFDDHTTQEAYLGIEFSSLPLTPNVSVYYDFNNGDGLYAQLSIGQSLLIASAASLDLSASLGYLAEQWVDETGFSDAVIGAALPLTAGSFSISPFFRYAFILMDEVNPEVDGEAFGGVSIAF